MLLNNTYKIIGILLTLLFLTGCGKKDSKPVNYNDMRAIKNLAAQLIDKKIETSVFTPFGSIIQKYSACPLINGIYP